MNKDLLELLTKILNSDLPKDTRNEVIRFYLLPRNTPVKGAIERVGKAIETLGRPDYDDLELENNPKLREDEESTAEALESLERKK